VAPFLPDSSILHSLIGDAVIDIPAPIVSRLERALIDTGVASPDSGLLARLSQAHHPLEASDAAWQEAGVSDERREALAQVSRSLGGLNTVLQVLWAALAHNRTPGAQGAVAAHVLQGAGAGRT